MISSVPALKRQVAKKNKRIGRLESKVNYLKVKLAEIEKSNRVLLLAVYGDDNRKVA